MAHIWAESDSGRPHEIPQARAGHPVRVRAAGAAGGRHARRPARGQRTAGAPYTVQLVEGVAANAERIDELIAAHAKGWTLDRMPTVDRNLLRIATYEITEVEDVPGGGHRRGRRAGQGAVDRRLGRLHQRGAVGDRLATVTSVGLARTSPTGSPNQIVRLAQSPGPRRSPEQTMKANSDGPSERVERVVGGVAVDFDALR